MISIVDEIAINSVVNVMISVEIVATIIAAAVVTGAMEGETNFDFTSSFDKIHISRRIALRS